MARWSCIQLLCVVVLLGLGCQEAFAFNAAGHKIIAEVAWRKLTPQQRKEIVFVLRKHPRFNKDFQSKMPAEIANGVMAEQDHWIFCQAAVWPDIARGIQPASEMAKYHRPRWHYINLPVLLDNTPANASSGLLAFNTSFDLIDGSYDNPNLNGVQAVKNSLKVVTTGADDKHMAVHYCWLIHVIPDLAQPLHSSALVTNRLFPDGDQGGNKISVRRGSSGDSQKLHSLWDAMLGKKDDFQSVQDKAGEIISSNNAEFNATFTAMPNDVWATESQAIAVQAAYGPLLDVIRQVEEGSGHLGTIRVSEDYVTNGKKVTEKQAVIAGVRLAGVLALTTTSHGASMQFAANSAGLSVPAVIASRMKTTQAEGFAPMAEMETENAPDSNLQERVRWLEEEVRRLRALLGARDARGPNAELFRAERHQLDDGEQCNCGEDE